MMVVCGSRYFVLISCRFFFLISLALAGLDCTILHGSTPDSLGSVLYVVGSKLQETQIKSKYSALLLSEQLIGYRLQVKYLDVECGPGSELFNLICSKSNDFNMSSPKGAWRLVGADQEVFDQGTNLPSIDRLVGDLELKFGASPIARLRLFLRKNPQHWEARHDLFRLLKERVLLVLENFPQFNESELDPESDRYAWGSIADELNIIFESSDWAIASRRFNIMLELPEGYPERQSPLVKFVYQRHRSNIQGMLKRCPENHALWTSLIRIQGTLGGALLGDLDNLPDHLEDSRGHVFLSIAMFMTRNLRDTSDWTEIKRNLGWIWETRVLPGLRKDGPSAFVDPRGSDPEGRGRQAIWSFILEPLAESMIRTGSEGEWPVIVGPAAGDIVTEVRVRQLLRRLNRDGLKDRLLIASFLSLGQMIFPKPLGFQRGLLLAAQGISEPESIRELQLLFGRSGFSLFVDLNPDFKLTTFLRWQNNQKYWAILDQEGKVLVEGESLPSEGILFKRFMDLNLQNDSSRLRNQLVLCPYLLGHVSRLAEEQGNLAISLLEWKVKHSAKGGQLRVTEEEESAWADHVSSIRRILDDPLGLTPGLLPLNGIEYWLKYCRRESDENGPEMKRFFEGLGRSLAVEYIPTIEAELQRRPSDSFLWLLWLDLFDFVQKDPVPFFESIQPSPLSVVGPTWPSETALNHILQRLRAAKKWTEIYNVLEPRWRRTVQSLKARGRDRITGSPQSNLPVTMVLMFLESVNRLGRSSEYDQISSEAGSFGIKVSPVDY